jgi:DNA mismatch endonuclease, patch repair protein
MGSDLTGNSRSILHAALLAARRIDRAEMTDTLPASRRSENMSRIGSKNTKPEMIVRQLIYGMGFRYRLHARDLPGKPDLVFRNRRKIIFVHGCFWHLHPGCPEGRIPGSRQDYWAPKLNRNRTRDESHMEALRTEGWQVLVIWECETKSIKQLEERVAAFLGT